MVANCLESFILAPIKEPVKLGKVITVCTFPISRSFHVLRCLLYPFTFYFSSQLYLHSQPQTLFKLEEMRTTSHGK